MGGYDNGYLGRDKSADVTNADKLHEKTPEPLIYGLPDKKDFAGLPLFYPF